MTWLAFNTVFALYRRRGDARGDSSCKAVRHLGLTELDMRRNGLKGLGDDMLVALKDDWNEAGPQARRVNFRSMEYRCNIPRPHLTLPDSVILPNCGTHMPKPSEVHAAYRSHMSLS